MLTLVVQPIVDLVRGAVVGFEVLSRFPDESPVEAFAAAAREGRGDALEAEVLTRALELRAGLPSNCFLSVNVGPQHLGSDVVRSVLRSAGSLRGLVLELTEHVAVPDYERLAADVAALRALGAAIAVDDAGAGYSSMRQVTSLRPEFVKVDRAFTAGLDRDPAKLALVEMLGSFAGRIDAWLIAEGVETDEELAALQRLGVPLAQGFRFARPGEPWPQPDVALVRNIAARAERARSETVESLLEGAPGVRGEAQARQLLDGDGRLDVVLLLDEWARPRSLLSRDAVRPTLRVAPTARIPDVARRAVTRDAAARFDPVVVCDESGRYLGIVRVERLVERLAG